MRWAPLFLLMVALGACALGDENQRLADKLQARFATAAATMPQGQRPPKITASTCLDSGDARKCILESRSCFGALCLEYPYRAVRDGDCWRAALDYGSWVRKGEETRRKYDPAGWARARRAVAPIRSFRICL